MLRTASSDRIVEFVRRLRLDKGRGRATALDSSWFDEEADEDEDDRLLLLEAVPGSCRDSIWTELGSSLVCRVVLGAILGPEARGRWELETVEKEVVEGEMDGSAGVARLELLVF